MSRSAIAVATALSWKTSVQSLNALLVVIIIELDSARFDITWKNRSLLPQLPHPYCPTALAGVASLLESLYFKIQFLVEIRILFD